MTARSNAIMLVVASIGTIAAITTPARPAASQDNPDRNPAPATNPPGAPADAAEAVPVPTRATVLHVPPSIASSGVDLRISAVVDAAWTEAALFLRYRLSGATGTFARRPFERSSAGGYYVTVPGQDIARPGVEYYIAGELPDGSEVVHFASAATPHRVLVSPSREARFIENERRRLGGHVSSVGASVWGHDFGNRFDNNDRFLRGEIDWTHRLLTRLYAISVGYGFIEGETPNVVGMDAMSVKRGARYGYGAVQLMLHRSVWLDGRAMLGVSRNGFIVGGGGALTLGRPWRSNLRFGAEYLQELGPSVSVRLQWDTAPPFLMGASIVKTDLPAAALPDGAYVVYDVDYPLLSRVMLRASVSFGSRDGAAHFGGGVGTAFAF